MGKDFRSSWVTFAPLSQIKWFALVKLCVNHIRNVFDLYDTVKPYYEKPSLASFAPLTAASYSLEIKELNYSNSSINCRFTGKLTYFDIFRLMEIQKIFSNCNEMTATRPGTVAN